MAKTKVAPRRMSVCRRIYWITIDSGHTATYSLRDAQVIAGALRSMAVPFRSYVDDSWDTRPLTFREAMDASSVQ
jgi:hypothetical protein